MTDNCAVGPLKLDYSVIHEDFGHFKLLFYLFAITWLVFLMLLTESTATKYFSPTLVSICNKLQLPDNLAGVTFLAFGNGAPDFFAIMATVRSKGADVNNEGIGALLGASVFVSTIVVGSIAINNDAFTVPHASFLRDISFHLLAAVSFAVIAIAQTVYWLMPATLIIIYILYVIFVFHVFDNETTHELPHVEHISTIHYPSLHKIRGLIEMPANFLRTITIPTTSNDNWNRTYAIIQPFASCMLFAFILQDSQVNGFSVPMICFIVGMWCSILSYFYLQDSTEFPTNSTVYEVLQLMVAFVMCIAWMYLLAGELVACLFALGQFMKIPASVLGMTVLAWSNSITDLFANNALAKNGHTEMAITGCYAGPVFNLLFSFGTSLLFASYQHAFVMKLEIANVVSIVFLITALASTLIIVKSRNFKFDQYLGYYLVCLYCAYTITQFTLLFVLNKTVIPSCG